MKIDLRDIQEGETEFAFEETPDDLHIAEEATQFAGAINTRLVVYKYGDSLSAKGQTTCLVRPECARCLESIEFPIAVSYTFVFQKGRPDLMDDDDDETLIWLNEEPGEIDLGDDVKDYILLELPMIPTCAALPSGPCERYEQDPTNCWNTSENRALTRAGTRSAHSKKTSSKQHQSKRNTTHGQPQTKKFKISHRQTPCQLETASTHV